MPIRAAAVALVVAAAVALQGALLYALVGAPLSSAMRALHGPAPAPVYEESITVVAERPPPKAKPAS